MAYHHLTPGGESLGALFKKAAPGDEILAHAGDHKLPDGGAKIEGVKGTQAHPIIFRPAGDGPVKITAKLPPIGKPDVWQNPAFRVRTLEFAHCDYIHILDFSKAAGHEIFNGIFIEGDGNAETIMGHDVEKAGGGGGGWPGFKEPDPEGFRGALLSRGFKPTHGMEVERCHLKGRGLALIDAWDARAEENEIHDLEASSGSAIHAAGGCSEVDIHKNRISGLKGSGGEGHFWNEAVRAGNRSYGIRITENKAWGLVGNSRGFTSDVFATWVEIVANEVETGNIGVSLQYAIYNALVEYNIVRGCDDAFKVSARDPGEVPFKGCVRGKVRYNDFSTKNGNNNSMVLRLISGYEFKQNRAEKISGTGVPLIGRDGNSWDGGSAVKPSPEMPPPRPDKPPVEPPVEPPPPPPPPVEPPPVEPPPVEPPPVEPPPVEPPVPGEVFDPALALAAVVKMREGAELLGRIRSKVDALSVELDNFRGLNEAAQKLEDEAKRVAG